MSAAYDLLAQEPTPAEMDGYTAVLADMLRDAEAVLETIADDCSEDDGESLRILIGRIRHALDAHDRRTLQRARRAA